MTEHDRPSPSVPFEDVTVVMLASSERMHRLSEWAECITTDAELSRCPVMVVYPAGHALESLHGLGQLEAGAQSLQLTESVDPDQAEMLRGYARVFDSITTPWFCLSSIPPEMSTYASKLKTHISVELARAAEVGLVSDRALLLYNGQRARTASRAYLWQELARLQTDPDPVLRDYLALLALSTANPQLEGVDLRAEQRDLELFARVGLGRFNSVDSPPWHYRFVVTDPSGAVVADQAAVVEQRLDNQGGRRWENVVGRLPLDDIPDGNHRLMIGIDTPHAALQRLQALQPRPGVLAPARTVLLGGAGAGPSAVDTRYLVHTVRGIHTWITLQRGSGKGALRRWDRSMLRKDGRAVLKGEGGKRMRLARLIRLVTRPYFRHKETWLIGERADTAQDNGFHFFRNLREIHPDRRVYYIIDRDSPQLSRVQHLGNVIGHSTVHHRLLMMHATVLANAYSIKHMIPRQWSAASYTSSLAWRVGAHRVYLKHGVHVSPTAVKRGTGGYDLYLSVNPQENAALRASSGYRDQVVETGMPRYDTLVPAPSTRAILFMPTWRRYLVPKLFGPDDEASVPFEGSTYERFITGLMHSPALHDILERHDYRLQLLPHYNLRQEMDGFEFTSDRTELADTTTHSFQDLIRGCDAFVTDYSSVHFDVAYLGTPIIYTHFDKDEYEEGHAVASWFDHATDAFGPVVYTLDETLAELDALLARGCTRDPAYQPRVDAAFTFHDHNNSARVVEQIDQMVDRARKGQ